MRRLLAKVCLAGLGLAGTPACGGSADDADAPAAEPDAAAMPTADAAATPMPDAAATPSPDIGLPEPDAAGPQMPDAAPAPPVPLRLGGDRPTTLRLPSAAPPADGFPLVLLLHGYRATSVLIDRQFGFGARVDTDGFALLVPDGLDDESGFAHWNTDRTGAPDDIGYLTGLVREALANAPIDPTRVYVVGHSNGGSMAYRLGCDAPDLFAGIVPVSILYRLDPETCSEGPPVNLLHVHGDQDQSHAYGGDDTARSVDETVEFFAERLACPGPPPVDGEPFDAEVTSRGAETLSRAYTGCAGGTSVGRWWMQGVGHVFILTPTGSERLLADVLAMRRTP